MILHPKPPCVRIFKVVRVLGWRHRAVARSVSSAGQKASVALASTIIDSSEEPVNHAIASLAATAHVSHDTMHASLKFVLAFLAVFVTL